MNIFFLLFSQPVVVIGLFVFGALSFLKDLQRMPLHFGGSNGTELDGEAEESAGQGLRRANSQIQLPTTINSASIYPEKSDEFDYEAFWEKAWEIAVANNKTLANTEKEQSSQNVERQPCPKVYIYETSFSSKDRAKDKDKVFGKKQRHHMTFSCMRFALKDPQS